MAHSVGPFTFEWNNITINNVEEVELTHEIQSEQIPTLDHKTLEFTGSFAFNAIITLAMVDVPIIGSLLPQFFVPYQGIMSTGELVVDEEGAIDVVPGRCDDQTYADLLVTSCGDPGNVFRGVNTRTVPEAISFDQYRQTVQIKFIGEAPAGQATIQLYRDGGIVIAS